MPQVHAPAAPSAPFPHAASLRIGIVHARWNGACIDALVQGSLKALTAAGVQRDNIVVESVPGSWELPHATARMIAAAQTQASSAATDLMSATSLLDPSESTSSAAASPSAPFDAVISIGVLIKGSTMHFEYISDACVHGLMRVGLDSNTPVILGVLTALTQEQAEQRSGIGKDAHNHGEDWGSAAVEMASKTKDWAGGKFSAQQK